MAERPKDGRGKGGKAGPRRGVIRRDKAQRKKIAPEFEALATGATDRLPPSPRRPRLKDPRTLALVPGVANREARAVFERRLGGLRAAMEEGPSGSEALERGLVEAVQLGLWRAKALTSFEALAVDQLGLDADEARARVEAGSVGLGVQAERCSDEAVALWFRAEAAFAEAGLPGAASVRTLNGVETLTLDLPVDAAPLAVDALGRQLGPLIRDRKQQPPK